MRVDRDLQQLGSDLNLNGLQIDNGVESGVTVGKISSLQTVHTWFRGVCRQLGMWLLSDYVYNYSNLKLRKNTTLTLSNGSTTIDTFSYSSSTHDTNAAGASLAYRLIRVMQIALVTGVPQQVLMGTVI